MPPTGISDTDGGVGLGRDLGGLRVSGNHLVNGNDQVVRLVGVNRSGTEYACIQGWGIFDGPSDDASLEAIQSWGANAVRVPLNEDCWLGINGVPAAYSGANYQAAISDYVSRITGLGMAAILELHWSAPGTDPATGQSPMPDRDHSVTFWRQVATAYARSSRVVFELFNEPYPDDNQDTDAAWNCWENGGTCPSLSYTAAGMGELVDAVRGTGASNVILLGGVEYSNSLTGWLSHAPSDPTGNLAAAWHVYGFNACSDATCFDAVPARVARSVPVVATEIGTDTCDADFMKTVMDWLDSRDQSYLAWTWDTWGTDCSSIALVSDYDGTPTRYGQVYEEHLASLPRE